MCVPFFALNKDSTLNNVVSAPVMPMYFGSVLSRARNLISTTPLLVMYGIDNPARYLVRALCFAAPAAARAPWWPRSARPGGREPGRLVAVTWCMVRGPGRLIRAPWTWWPVAAIRGPWSRVRAPWRVSEYPPTPGPKKRAGSRASRALALFHTVCAA